MTQRHAVGQHFVDLCLKRAGGLFVESPDPEWILAQRCIPRF